MSDQQQLYSVTATFNTADEIVHAAGEVAKEGYSKFDVHTPFPVHGMDHAMRLKTSKVGFFALAFGTTGTLTAILFISWVTLSDYPLVIGGKPFWSWPAFVPVSFELTVLLAAVLSTLAMIVVYFKFPNISHPLHNTAFMKAVSSNKYGISIEAADPKFSEAKVKDLLRKLGGQTVAPVYYDLSAITDRPKLFNARFIAILVAVALVMSGTTYVTLNKVLYWQPFNWMMDQPKLKAQKPSALFGDGIGMRQPVKGTVARGFLPYPFKNQPDSAGKYLLNPLLPTREVIDRGRGKFLTFCSPCHGNFGRGDSRLRGQFPNPPTLHSDKVRDWPDGNIYHVITEGQNVMPSYDRQIPREDRWAIIHYLRVLERAQHPQEADLK
jgi:hypothetical protein